MATVERRNFLKGAAVGRAASQLGFRVPALGISPYSRKGYVNYDGPFQHASTLKFIEYRYGLEPLTSRDANSKNIGEAFDYSRPPRLDYGIEPMETPTIFFSSGCGIEDEGMDDFQRFAASGYMESVGYRVGQPPWDELFGNAPKKTIVPG